MPMIEIYFTLCSKLYFKINDLYYSLQYALICFASLWSHPIVTYTGVYLSVN